MNQQPHLGTNRTGIAVAPERAKAMQAGMEAFPPTSQGNVQELLAQVRMVYAKESSPLGSVPQPTGLKNKVQTAVKAISGEQPTLFVDKLGERLAFERSGTRLYEALLAKHHIYGSFSGGPTPGDLEHVLQEEYRHFLMLQSIIEQMGGDPTAVTPAADIQGTMAQGIRMVIVDPRTTLLQSLEAILVAELTDSTCWETLVELAQKAGEDDLVQSFRQAHVTELDHLQKVRTWVAAGQGRT
jgi:hypothetical protein